jgi:DNA topoisomerase-1
VKKLEELGIGRPSTYASIISVLQDRGYVRLDKKRFVAEMLGKLVNAFLVSYFEHYVEYDFTAELERHLDEVSEGKYDWKTLLRDFWKDFIEQVGKAKELKITDVLNTLDKILEPFIFGTIAPGTDPRVCPKCGTGRLGLKSGKFGAFLGCSNYPECKHTQQLSIEAGSDSGSPAAGVFEERVLGNDPASGMAVHLKKGPYGIYVQLGEEKKPKRTSLPRGINPASVTLEQALGLLALPREVGTHPETSKVIKAGIGRFGPYLQHDGAYVSLKGDDDVLTIGINRAVTLIAEKETRGGGRKKFAALKTLGKHPDDEKPVELFEGKYGPYVKHGKKNATVPKGTSLDDVTLEQALTLLAAKGGKSKKKPAAKAAKKKKSQTAESE